MIWQEEVKREIRHREWVAFYSGCLAMLGIMLIGGLAYIHLTGGFHPALCP